MNCEKPMRAGKMADLKKLCYPLLASLKLDGMRATIQGDSVLTKTNKLLPNLYTQDLFGKADLHGMDGEMIVGPPNRPLADEHGPSTMGATASGLMSKRGEPNVKFYVFDDFSQDLGFFVRWKFLKKRVKDLNDKRVVVVDQRMIQNEVELIAFEQEALDAGYEGLMLRAPSGPYKHGTSTENEGYLLKMKRWLDNEALIIGFNERMHNANDKDASGKRTTHKAGKVPLDTMGSLQVVGINGDYDGIGFDCPVPDPADQQWMWARRPQIMNCIVTYKHFPGGTKTRPRFPGFLRFRDSIDI